MSTTKSKPAGGAIDINKLRGYVDKHSKMLKDRAAINGEIRALLNQADDAGFDKKAVEAVSKRKSKDREAAIAFGHKVEEYEVALGLATPDMFSGDPEPDAAAEAKAEAHDDPVPVAPSPKVPALAPPKAKKAKKAKAKKATTTQDPEVSGSPPDTEDVAPATTEFAYEAGKRAAKAGWAETRNPYKQDEGSKAQWASGYKDGMNEAFAPTPPDTPQDTERAPA